ncbi:MAG: hypothetical protein JNL74_17190 [Fibrobacteres bacterium]|nr:hypothetical protein [Fibrobacterota bacterium]
MFVLLLLALISVPDAAYRDITFKSSVLGLDRKFRVWTGAGFDSSGTTRYPVIYYCHGCGGSYAGDSYSSYAADGGYEPPICSTGCVYPLTKPFNADFQAFTNDNNAIVVMIDGGIAGTGGCLNNWFFIQNSPGLSKTYMNLGKYFAEIVSAVDSLYPTKASPQFRAVTGLSMGGQAAIDIAAQVPHLIRSVSTFCHSPTRNCIGDSVSVAVTDVQELWRNLRWHSTRTTANTGDYIYSCSRELSLGLMGAGLNHEYLRTPFYRHWAFRVDSQLNFHMRTFNEDRSNEPTCFSYVTFYPQSEGWGYSITAQKRDTGWIYLKDVTPSGFSLLTRKFLPFGYSLAEYPVTVKTAPRYTPNASYSIQKYNYRTALFTSSSITADSAGRLSVNCAGGMGEVFGISGNGIRKPIVLLTDTVNEDISIFAGRDTAIGAILANLGIAPATGVAVYTTTTGPMVTVKNGYKYAGTLQPQMTKKIDSLMILRGEKILDSAEANAVGFQQHLQYGFVKVRFSGTDIDQDREHLIRVFVADPPLPVDSSEVKIFDGRSETLTIMKGSTSNTSFNVISSQYVSEGRGNGDGKIDSGEVFTIWIKSAKGWVTQDANTWHPAVCVNGQNSAVVQTVGMREYTWNRNRSNLSAEMQLTKKLSDSLPSELILKVEHLGSFSGGQKGRDASVYKYYSLKLPLKFAISAEKAGFSGSEPKIKAEPNPFNPSTVINLYSGNYSGEASVEIYDIKGRLINTVLKSKVSPASIVSVCWNGSDAAGKKLPSGAYLVRYRLGSHVKTLALTLMK